MSSSAASRLAPATTCPPALPRPWLRASGPTVHQQLGRWRRRQRQRRGGPRRHAPPSGPAGGRRHPFRLSRSMCRSCSSCWSAWPRLLLEAASWAAVAASAVAAALQPQLLPRQHTSPWPADSGSRCSCKRRRCATKRQCARARQTSSGSGAPALTVFACCHYPRAACRVRAQVQAAQMRTGRAVRSSARPAVRSTFQTWRPLRRPAHRARHTLNCRSHGSTLHAARPCASAAQRRQLWRRRRRRSPWLPHPCALAQQPCSSSKRWLRWRQRRSGPPQPRRSVRDSCGFRLLPRPCQPPRSCCTMRRPHWPHARQHIRCARRPWCPQQRRQLPRHPRRCSWAGAAASSSSSRQQQVAARPSCAQLVTFCWTPCMTTVGCERLSTHQHFRYNS